MQKDPGKMESMIQMTQGDVSSSDRLVELETWFHNYPAPGFVLDGVIVDAADAKIAEFPVHMISGKDDGELRPYPCLLKSYRDEAFHLEENMLAQGEALDVHVEGHLPYTLSRTPGDDDRFILGNLVSRSFIAGKDDVASVRFYCRRGREQAMVCLRAGEIEPPRRKPLQNTRCERFQAEKLFRLQDRLDVLQSVRKKTGRVHGAALFGLDSKIISFGEDVGPHNALDKAIGGAVADNAMQDVSIAMLSSRLTLEQVLKAVQCRIPILVGGAVATAAAVESAQSHGITLVGGLHKGTMSVYSHSWRLV